MPHSDLCYSITFCDSIAYVLDNEGFLWNKDYSFGVQSGFCKMKCELPPCRNIFSADGKLYVIDYSGDVWEYKKTYCNGLLALTSDGVVYNKKEKDVITLSNLSPMRCISGDEICAGIDYDGNIWTWDQINSNPTKVYFSDMPAKSLIVENRRIKIIGNSGILYKCEIDSDGELSKLFDHYLTPIRSISASGRHTIVLDENDHMWSWGNNSNNQCGKPERKFILFPEQVQTRKWQSVVSGIPASLAVTSDGNLYEFCAGINQVSEIEQVFIHKPIRFKSARN